MSQFGIKKIFVLVPLAVLLILSCKFPTDPTPDRDEDPLELKITLDLLPFTSLPSNIKDERITRVWAKIYYAEGSEEFTTIVEDFVTLGTNKTLTLAFDTWPTMTYLYAQIVALAGEVELYTGYTDLQGPFNQGETLTLELYPSGKPFQIEAGSLTSMYRTPTGKIFALGDNGTGILGQGNYNNDYQSSFVELPQINNGEGLTRWGPFSAKYEHGIFTNETGPVYATGKYDYSDIDNVGSSNVAAQVLKSDDNLLQSIVSLSAGADHTLAIDNEGRLWGWGNNRSSQLGLGEEGALYSSKAIQIGTDSDWAEVAAGYKFSLAIKSNGTIWAWGLNNLGQAAIDGGLTVHEPTQIGTGTNWVAIAAGNHAMALKNDGTLWVWGDNSFGELGIGNLELDYLATPTQVGTSRWLAINATTSNSIAIRFDGTIWAWGDNSWGQVGDGTTERAYSPKQVGSHSNWIQISIGGSHSLALNDQGEIWGWGYKPNLAIENDTGNQVSPIEVETLELATWVPPTGD